MKRLFVLAFVLQLVQVGFGADKATSDLQVDGRFTVPVPAKGFTWTKVQDLAVGNVKGALFVASDEAAKTQVVLIVQYDVVKKTDEERSNEAKGAHRGWLNGLKRRNFYSDVHSDAPAPKSPVAEQVEFVGRAKDPNGDPVAFHVVVLFGKKNTYHFQVTADSKADAADLAKVASKLVEK